MNWKAVARDTAIVLGLTFLGGMVVGVAFGVMGAQGSEQMQIAIGFSNITFGVVAFTIAGCLARTNRFRHLFIVAAVSWIISLMNLLLGYTLAQWLIGGVLFLIMVGIGGGLSFLFVRTPQTDHAQEV